MISVTDKVIKAVKHALVDRGWSQAELARKLGKKPQHVSKLIAGNAGRVTGAWQELLDELGLEITAIKKSDA
jgi:ribosome-binding protein aMBF1 (putative translation factor)